MFDDTPVTRRSRDEVEQSAEHLRRVLDPLDQWAPDILELIKRAKDLEGFSEPQVIFLPDAEMEGAEARAEFNPPRIYIRKSLETDVIANGARARATIAHELGHLVLHPGLPKPRKTLGNSKVVNLSSATSAEAQAWWFARAFLMPSWKMAQVNSAEELSTKCKVSTAIAKIRYDAFVQVATRRPELLGIGQAISEIRAAGPKSSADPRIVAERARFGAWERARHITGEDPLKVRRSDDSGTGYRIEYGHYGNALSPFGWFVEDGRALAYLGKI